MMNSDVFITYHQTLYAMTAVAALMIVQIVVVDVFGIKARHLPGKPVEADHGNFLFRATRVLGNTNESIAIFIILAIVCILSAAGPLAVGICSWAYFAARLGHTVFYYANIGVARSICFGLSLLALVALLITAIFGVQGA